jgi:hypothetical protein
MNLSNVLWWRRFQRYDQRFHTIDAEFQTIDARLARLETNVQPEPNATDFIRPQSAKKNAQGKTKGKWIADSTLFLLVFLVYELALFAQNIVVHIINVSKGTTPYYPFKPMAAEDIFHGLILSTTAVAFVGAHYVVGLLVDKDNHEEIKKNVPAIAFLLLAAVLLAALIVVHDYIYCRASDKRIKECAGIEDDKKYDKKKEKAANVPSDAHVYFVYLQNRASDV